MKHFAKNIVLAVAEQFANMFSNDILAENGGESFIGWLEDGEVFELNGMTEEEINECMEFAKLVTPQIDNAMWAFESQLKHE